MVWLSEDDERPQVARQSLRSRGMFTIFRIININDDPELIEVLLEDEMPHIFACH